MSQHSQPQSGRLRRCTVVLYIQISLPCCLCFPRQWLYSQPVSASLPKLCCCPDQLNPSARTAPPCNTKRTHTTSPSAILLHLFASQPRLIAPAIPRCASPTHRYCLIFA